MTSRTATLVLCTEDVVHGVLAPLRVDPPWWQEAEDVVAAVRREHGLAVTVLRLLDVSTQHPSEGGEVTYLAETPSRPALPLVRWEGPDPLVDDPRRAAWARPGGPAADLAWAGAVLSALGRPPRGPAVQVRTWNLASLWRIGTADGTVWLKVVADLLAPEGPLLELLDRCRPGTGPDVVAQDGRRVLLEEVPGADLYDAGPAVLGPPVTDLVGLQDALAADVDAVLALGVPDRGPVAVVERVSGVVERCASRLGRGSRDRLRSLLRGLPARLDAVAGCGLPPTLVHGDLHPGNLRGTATDVRLLDWADATVGRPELDGLRLVGAVAPADRAAVRDAWCRAWVGARPGADPGRALDLLAPVAAALAAATYQGFLDGIEPDEHVYHRHDPLRCLEEAAAALPAGVRGRGRSG